MKVIKTITNSFESYKKKKKNTLSRAHTHARTGKFSTDYIHGSRSRGKMEKYNLAKKKININK